MNPGRGGRLRDGSFGLPLAGAASKPGAEDLPGVCGALHVAEPALSTLEGECSGFRVSGSKHGARV